MEHEILRIIVSLLGTSAAAYYDIFNRKNIPDLLLYSFLSISLIFAIIDGTTRLAALGMGLIIGLLGYLFYRVGQIGMGDVIVFVSLSLLLPYPPSYLNTYRIPFILIVFFYTTLLFIIYVLVRFTPIVIRERKKYKPKPWQVAYSVLMIASYVLFLYVSSNLPIPNILIKIVMGLLVAASVFFTLFRDVINRSMVEELPIDKIDDDEVIAIEYIDPEKVRKYSIPRVFRKEHAKRLNKHLKRLPVYTGLPMFLPFILVGLILSLLLGMRMF